MNSDRDSPRVGVRWRSLAFVSVHKARAKKNAKFGITWRFYSAFMLCPETDLNHRHADFQADQG